MKKQRQSKGTVMVTKALITPNALAHAPKDLVFRVSTYDGRTPEAKPIFSKEACETILDFVKIKPKPNEEEQELRRDGIYNKIRYSRGNGSDVFGGLHNTIEENFEYVRGIPHIIARDEVEGVEKDGLFDIDGNLLANIRYDSMRRYERNLIERNLIDDDIFLVKEKDKSGLMLPDGSLIGKENGMQEGEVNLKKFAREVCLHAQKPEQELHVSKQGQILYNGWSAKLEEFNIGKDIFGLAKDDQGQGQLCTRDGEAVFGSKHIDFHKVMFPHELGILLQAYDKEGLTVLDILGNNHYGPHHKDPNKKGAEMESIDQEALARFHDEDKEDSLVRYWRFDNTLAYGGSHEEELQAGKEDSEEPFIISIGKKYSTAKKFRDKGLEGYFSKDPIDEEGHCELFAGLHKKQTDFVAWRGMPYIGFEDEQGICYFEWTGEKVFGGYHDKNRVKKVKQLSFTKGEVQETSGDLKERYAFLEVAEPAPLWRWLVNIVRWRRPSNFYSIDGEKFTSIKDIQKRYSIPEGEKLRPISDTAAMPAITPEKAQEVLQEETDSKNGVHPLGIVHFVNQEEQKSEENKE